MPLFALRQLHAGEGLEQQAAEFGDIDARGVDEGVVLPADPADLPFIGDRQAKRPGQFVVDAVATRTGVDQGLDLLIGKIGTRTGRGPGLEPDIHQQGRTQLDEQVGRRRGAFSGLKARVRQGRAPA